MKKFINLLLMLAFAGVSIQVFGKNICCSIPSQREGWDGIERWQGGVYAPGLTPSSPSPGKESRWSTLYRFSQLSADTNKGNLAQQAEPAYKISPVLDRDFPDPTVIKVGKMYYAYATQSRYEGKMINIQVASSTDHEHWKYEGDALPQKPSWASNTQSFWAPDVFFDAKLKKFVMFFSGETNDHVGKGMGVAYADNPLGPFVDKGEPLMKGPSSHCIDPKGFTDPKTGKHMIYWGSDFEPLRVQEMTDDWLSLKPGSSPTVVVLPGKDKTYSKLVEGSWLDYYKGTYYLYYSGDYCCGINANYAVMIAKADNPFGPFTRLGESNGSLNSAILVKDSTYTAPGHNSIFQDEKGRRFIAYHAIEIAHREKGRVMCINPIVYKNGWPVVIK